MGTSEAPRSTRSGGASCCAASCILVVLSIFLFLLLLVSVLQLVVGAALTNNGRRFLTERAQNWNVDISATPLEVREGWISGFWHNMKILLDIAFAYGPVLLKGFVEDQGAYFELLQNQAGGERVGWSGGMFVWDHETVTAEYMKEVSHRGPYINMAKIPGVCMDEDVILLTNGGPGTLHDEVHAFLIKYWEPIKKGILSDPIRMEGEWDPDSRLSLEEGIQTDLAKAIFSSMFEQDDLPPKVITAMLELNHDIPHICVKGQFYHSLKPGELKGVVKNKAIVLDAIRNSPGGQKLKVNVEKAIAAGELRNLTTLPASEKHPNQLHETTYDMMLRQIYAATGFAAMVGTAQYALDSVNRIHSNPKVYRPLYYDNPIAFMHEQARIYPAVPATNPVRPTPWTVNLSTPGNPTPVREITIPEMQPYMAVIFSANHDPKVFGGPTQSDSYARVFDPGRENLDQILTWNAPLKNVKEFSAPRGCPGYQLSMRLAMGVVEKYMPPEGALPANRPMKPTLKASPPVIRTNCSNRTDQPWACVVSLAPGVRDGMDAATQSYVLGEDSSFSDSTNPFDKIGFLVWLVACLMALGVTCRNVMYRLKMCGNKDAAVEQETGQTMQNDGYVNLVCCRMLEPLQDIVTDFQQACGPVTTQLVAFLVAEVLMHFSHISGSRILITLSTLLVAVPALHLVITAVVNFGFNIGPFKSTRSRKVPGGFCVRSDYCVRRFFCCRCCWCALLPKVRSRRRLGKRIPAEVITVNPGVNHIWDPMVVIGYIFSVLVWSAFVFVSGIALVFWFLFGPTSVRSIPVVYTVSRLMPLIALFLFFVQRWRDSVNEKKAAAEAKKAAAEKDKDKDNDNDPAAEAQAVAKTPKAKRSNSFELPLGPIVIAGVLAILAPLVIPEGQFKGLTKMLVFSCCLPFVVRLSGEMDKTFPRHVVLPNFRHLGIIYTLSVVVAVFMVVSIWPVLQPTVLPTVHGDICAYHRIYIKDFNRSHLSAYDEEICTGTALSELQDAFATNIYMFAKKFTALPIAKIRARQDEHAVKRPKFEFPIGRKEIIPGQGWYVATDDEDVWESRDWVKQRIVNFLLEEVLTNTILFPLSTSDEHTPWEDNALDDGKRALQLAVGEYIPQPNNYWDDIDSDSMEALTRMTFQGICGQRLSLADESENATFKSDFSVGVNFGVRPGYERYGSVAYFDADRKPLRITKSWTGQTAYPHDPSWKHFMYHFKTSCVVLVTATEHLSKEHLTLSNIFATNVREQLGVNHPVRLFLKPYLHRTPTVNMVSSEILTPENSLLHRTLALDYQTGLVPALMGSIKSTRLCKDPMEKWRPVLQHFGEEGWAKFPFGYDGVQFLDLIRNHVKSYLQLYYGEGGQQELQYDLGLRKLWGEVNEVAPFLGLPPLDALTFDDLWQYLSSLVFEVTGMHTVVGNVAEYLSDPRFAGVRIRRGDTRSDVQGSFYGNLVVMLTGLNSTKIEHKFLHLLRNDEFLPETTALMEKFMVDLNNWGEEVDRLNEKRSPFYGFHPHRVLSSVSI